MSSVTRMSTGDLGLRGRSLPGERMECEQRRDHNACHAREHERPDEIGVQHQAGSDELLPTSIATTALIRRTGRGFVPPVNHESAVETGQRQGQHRGGQVGNREPAHGRVAETHRDCREHDDGRAPRVGCIEADTASGDRGGEDEDRLDRGDRQQPSVFRARTEQQADAATQCGADEKRADR